MKYQVELRLGLQLTLQDTDCKQRERKGKGRRRDCEWKTGRRSDRLADIPSGCRDAHGIQCPFPTAFFALSDLFLEPIEPQGHSLCHNCDALFTTHWLSTEHFCRFKNAIRDPLPVGSLKLNLLPKCLCPPPQAPSPHIHYTLTTHSWPGEYPG